MEREGHTLVQKSLATDQKGRGPCADAETWCGKVMHLYKRISHRPKGPCLLHERRKMVQKGAKKGSCKLAGEAADWVDCKKPVLELMSMLWHRHACQIVECKVEERSRKSKCCRNCRKKKKKKEVVYQEVLVHVLGRLLSTCHKNTHVQLCQLS
eukprot:scaffold208488_cov15-Tisochrysis_lutea.AAC.1